MNLYTCCKLNQDNYLLALQLTMCSVPCSVGALIPLMDYHSAPGFKGQLLQLWDMTSVSCTYPTVFRHFHSTVLALTETCGHRERAYHSSCHVNIIQSDVWLICFPILITLHINSYYQRACFSTS